MIEWLGKGAALSLSAPLLQACAALDEHPEAPDGGAADVGRDVSGPGDARSDGFDAVADAPGDTASDGPPGDAPVGDGFPFRPGDGSTPVFREWGERTVDPQDLREILASWRLAVGGMVEEPRILTFEDLIALPRHDQVMDFHCVEGWSVHDVPWNGVHLSRILALVRPLAGATHVTFPTIGDRYNDSLPIEVALEPHTMLAYGVGGATLPLPHGFPLRVVVPRLFGYKSAKYVDRIELADRPVYSYWVRAGYPYLGEVPASRLREGRY